MLAPAPRAWAKTVSTDSACSSSPLSILRAGRYRLLSHFLGHYYFGYPMREIGLPASPG